MPECIHRWIVAWLHAASKGYVDGGSECGGTSEADIATSKDEFL